MHVDPIEKKPFFHLLPGSSSFSIATAGCNLKCTFCQNHSISQLRRKEVGDYFEPAEIVRMALQSRCVTIAYTYSEPTIFFEFALDTARLAASNGLRNVFVTNGFITPEALDEIAPFLHGANVDLKCFSEETYERVMGGKLQPVLDTIGAMKARGIWVEVTTLLVPGMNDSDGEVRDIARFLRTIDPSLPWHVSAFHPDYKMLDHGPTGARSLLRAREIGVEEGLRYVYCGNMPGMEGESTFCHGCGSAIIERSGFALASVAHDGGICRNCATAAAGVWR